MEPRNRRTGSTTRKLNDLDGIFFALSNPTRRNIVERLIEGGEMSVGRVASQYRLSVPSVSKHLDVLGQAGLKVRERDGRMIHCRLNPGPLARAADWVAKYEPLWNKQLDSFELYLDELKKKKPKR